MAKIISIDIDELAGQNEFDDLVIESIKKHYALACYGKYNNSDRVIGLEIVLWNQNLKNIMQLSPRDYIEKEGYDEESIEEMIQALEAELAYFRSIQAKA